MSRILVPTYSTLFVYTDTPIVGLLMFVVKTVGTIEGKTNKGQVGEVGLSFGGKGVDSVRGDEETDEHGIEP